MDSDQELMNVALPAQVLVVGAGIAGICAAISAAELGASVIVLDRAHGGGSSAISGGVIYAGGGTRQQIDAGYGDDTPENMFRYLQHETGDAVDESTLRAFCDESVGCLEWLEGYGVRFAGSLCPFKASYPTRKYFLYFSGNEKAHPFASIANPAPRGHRAMGKGSGGMGMTGEPFWGALFDSAVEMGVKFQMASSVERLLVDPDGRVIGVEYRAIEEATKAFADHRRLTQRAMTFRRWTIPALAKWYEQQAERVFNRNAEERTFTSTAVILAAGGFAMNSSMTESLVPWAMRTVPLGTATDDGLGIRLGQSIGGAVSHMDRMSAWRLLYAPEAMLEGIAVSAKGDRIAAEDLYGASFSSAMVDKHNGEGYLILDSVQWRRIKAQVYEQTEMPWKAFIWYLVYWARKKAFSLEDVARKLKIDSKGLVASVTAYNDAIVGGKPDPVGKLELRSVISTAPFYGIDISLRPSGMMMVPAFTLGGLRVDGRSGAVLTESGGPIQGLFAAGRNAVGICSNSYISGLSLADCVFSGRRAGKVAAKSE